MHGRVVISCEPLESRTLLSTTVDVQGQPISLGLAGMIGSAAWTVIQDVVKRVEATAPSGWTPLFNGTNLDGFYTFLPGEGINNDSRGVFKAENGLLHILGIPNTDETLEFGYISTTKDYSDYRLRFDFKWGTKKFAPRADEIRDSGLMFHARGIDKIYPDAAEFQIQEGDTGDIWIMERVRGTTTVAPGESGTMRQYQEGGESFTSTEPYTRIIKHATPESLAEWNTCEVIAQGDNAIYIVNGVVVNRIQGLNIEGTPLTSGKIMFQAEGAEIFYRNIQIQPLQFTPPPSDATVLFNGGGTDAWRKFASDAPIDWMVVGNALEVNPGSGDIITRDDFTDFVLHLEFRNNLTPGVTNEQDQGNSGVYLQGRYEVQILDSYGKTLSGENDNGAIYGVSNASMNASFPAEAWQAYDITFTAARWDGATKTSNARVTVKLNGVTIHENIEIPTSTNLGGPESPAAGPILLQDHGNRVQFRNIWIKAS